MHNENNFDALTLEVEVYCEGPSAKKRALCFGPAMMHRGIGIYKQDS